MPQEVKEPVSLPDDFAAFEQIRNKGEMPNLEVETPVAPAKTAAESGPAETQEEKEQRERDEKGRFKPKESEVPTSVQKRIDQFRAKQGEAERRAEAAERKLAELTQAPKPAASDPKDPEPQESQFENYGLYVKAQARWEARQELTLQRAKDAEAETKKREQEASQQSDTERQAAAARWSQSEVDARAKHEDFDEALATTADVPLAPHVQIALLLSDSQAELAYHLATNRAELERIAQLPAHRIGYEIGKLEAKLAAPPAPPEPQGTKAPKPVSPVSTRSAPAFDATDPKTDYGEWERKRNEQLRSNGKRY